MGSITSWKYLIENYTLKIIIVLTKKEHLILIECAIVTIVRYFYHTERYYFIQYCHIFSHTNLSVKTIKPEWCQYYRSLQYDRWPITSMLLIMYCVNNHTWGQVSVSMNSDPIYANRKVNNQRWFYKN